MPIVPRHFESAKFAKQRALSAGSRCLGVGYGEAPHPDIFTGVSNAWLWLAERAGILAALTHLALVGGAAWAAFADRCRRSGDAAGDCFAGGVLSWPGCLIITSSAFRTWYFWWAGWQA